MYSISVKYNVKINALRRWNKIDKNKKLHIKDIIFLENPKLVNQ
ncbi:LysM peptidoglycan-binding domain-containing protein [Colwellia sp. MSW7]|uniref:LysM peptidoglycan-binding domain-containing protein n=1 Tax=Colwellia maritima TaxID=2912588 RepID=A0ABS9WY27_9GAMM|nr:LysM domain-containing protein [Colwellia maritima]MCI2282905.1 LysM peptidoglycan-binding domain-containing protein [Colwellia maritima]